MKNQKGVAHLAYSIVMLCFAFVIVIIILAMLNTADVGDKIEAAIEDQVQESCERLCELDYFTGISNVVEYQKCLSDCAQ